MHQDYYRSWKKNNSFRPLSANRFRPVSALRQKFTIARLPGKIIRFFLKKGLIKQLIFLALAAGLIVFILGGGLFIYYSFALPDPNKLVERQIPESTKIYDRNDKLLYEIYDEAKRTLIPLDQVPTFAKQATIAVEDKDFYKHPGIDLTGIVRSAVIDVITRSKEQGASTITQQFVRNAVLTREKSWIRKFKEIVLALQLERKYSKDEILQLYLNEIPYGNNAYGIQAASQTYFNKNAQDLTLTEAAYLAALPQAPTFYSPYGVHREELDARADTVLQLMRDQGYITEEEKTKAQKEVIQFRDIDSGNGTIGLHFSLYVQDLLAQKYGELALREGGYSIKTSLDLDLQKIAEEAVREQVAVNEKTYNAGNAALVAIDPKTGQILAMVGSRDYFDKEHDGAVNVALRPRQPGSSFKPYVYAAAFKEGMNPATMLMDVVTNFGNFGGEEYIPRNYDGKEHGPVSIRKALQGSLNIPAVKTILLIGIGKALDMAENMGITTLKDRSRYGPSLVLGGGEVTLLDHTSAYGVFATGGIRHDPVAILEIKDNKGRVLEKAEESRGREVLDPQVAYLMNNVLSDNDARAYVFGQNNRLTIPGRRVAAKTGTTQEYKDAWTVGYTPNLVAGVWAGNNNGKEMTRAGGSLAAAPIWQEFMKRALEKFPAEDFAKPDGIVEMEVDELSGKLPTSYTPSVKKEVFASFNTPKEEDDVHVLGTINGETKVITVLHSEKPNDPAWEDPVRNWALANGYSYPTDGSSNTGSRDTSIEINLTAPTKVTELPWKIEVRASPENQIDQVDVFLDGSLLTESQKSSFDFTSRDARVNGRHLLMVQARNKSGKTNSQSATIEFALGKEAVMLQPTENQILNFPNNLVVESSIDIAAENVRFQYRNSLGQEADIQGSITKRRSGNIFIYTLNWAADQKPLPGSYALSAIIQNAKSQEVTVKIL